MKKIMPWMVAMMVLAIGSAANGGEGEIAHLDQRRILQALQRGDMASAQLKEEMEQKQEEFELKKVAIREMREKFGVQEATLREDEREKQRKELTKKATALIDALTASQREMQAKKEFVASKLIERLRSMIQEFASENGYRYVLDSGDRGVLVADDSLDITEAVLEKIE